jgi:4-hydroxy-3-methylbut-2-enyl diphosphate reductase IspH
MATRDEALLPVAAPLRLLPAPPGGVCAGVARAINALEAALARFGPPLYVRHEIVHGRLDGPRTVGATSAPAPPDLLIDQLIAWFAARQALVIEEQGPLREDTTCKMPSLDPLT